MVAECLGVLGLPIGVPIPAPPEMFNYEDPELQAVLHRAEPGQVDLPQLRKLIAIRNELYFRWGFKLPMALNSLSLLESELRHPAFVIVMRDVVATASRENIATAVDFPAALRQAMSWQQRLLDFFAVTTSPCLLVSYEKALQLADLTTAVLAHWAGVEANPEECRRAANHIQPNSEAYLRGVRYQCDAFGIPSARAWRIRGDLNQE